MQSLTLTDTYMRARAHTDKLQNSVFTKERVVASFDTTVDISAGKVFVIDIDRPTSAARGHWTSHSGFAG